MKIYLAGGLTGNLSGRWKEIARHASLYEDLFSRRERQDTLRSMKIYLAGENGKTRFLRERERERELLTWPGSILSRTETEAMKIYLAGEHPIKNGTANFAF